VTVGELIEMMKDLIERVLGNYEFDLTDYDE
jgi:hypothetical protein